MGLVKSVALVTFRMWKVRRREGMGQANKKTLYTAELKLAQPWRLRLRIDLCITLSEI